MIILPRAFKALTAALPFVVASLLGCYRGKLPPLELYRLGMTNRSQLETPVSTPRLILAPGSVAIAPYQAPGVYGGRGIVFRIGDAQYGVYPTREWAVPVATMLGLVTEDVLRGAPLTRDGSIYDPPAYRENRYIWRGIVRELEEVDRGRSVFVSVRFDVRLVRALDDSVLWSGSARLERPVPKPTMTNIVDALSLASADVIAQLADQARAMLAREAASAAER